MIQRDFFKITGLYTIGIIITFFLCWMLLGVAVPEAKLNLVQTLTTAFGVNIPDNMPISSGTQARTALVILILSALSIGLVVLNVFFSAVITARFIRPRVNLVTSQRGVLSTVWNPAMPYVLIRMSNFYQADLVDVVLNVNLTVEETHIINGQPDTFRTYFPLENYTPQRILVMEQRMPWSIAVPGDALLANSKRKDYAFRPGSVITESITKDGKPATIKRELQILIQGTDARSYSHFVIHKNILIDEQQGQDYKLHLHRGSFKSLPLRIAQPEDIEQYV